MRTPRPGTKLYRRDKHRHRGLYKGYISTLGVSTWKRENRRRWRRASKQMLKQGLEVYEQMRRLWYNLWDFY